MTKTPVFAYGYAAAVVKAGKKYISAARLFSTRKEAKAYIEKRCEYYPSLRDKDILIRIAKVRIEEVTEDEKEEE